MSLKVAIIGAGPAGLAAAIALNRLDHIEWKLYDKKPIISEISNGLTVQSNTWRILENLGAAKHLTADAFFRPTDGHNTQHRNGLTGQLLATNYPPADRIHRPHQEACRAHRARLQQALLKEVDQAHVRVGHKLVRFDRLPSGRVRIVFADGFEDEVDLLVGADGLRSVVRSFAFPAHTVKYTGATAYRTLVRTSDALRVNGLPKAVVFWHGTGGNWVYTCPLGGDDFEITARVRLPETDETASWGRPAAVTDFTDAFADYAPPVRQLLEKVTYVEQYDYFSGPRLSTIIHGESLALIGDSSHPLSGAFGAGVGFALEDAYVLGEALAWAHRTGRALGDALRLLDRIRTPHYNALYGVLDKFAAAAAAAEESKLDPDGEIAALVAGVWSSKDTWMYYYTVETAVEEAIREEESKEGSRTEGRGRPLERL